MLPLLAGCVAACSGDDLGPPPADLVGSWASISFEFVSKEGLGHVDADARGWSASMLLDADRTGTLAFHDPTDTGWTWTGAWEVDGDLFRISGQGADISLRSGRLTLTGFDGGYDFDADGERDPAKINLVLLRAPRRDDSAPHAVTSPLTPRPAAATAPR